MASKITTDLPVTPEKVLLCLNDLRKEGKYCDMVINIGKLKFPCHRGILVSCIPYFEAMFGGNFEETDETETTLKDIDENGFQHLLGYLYTGRIEINSDTVKEILSVAAFFTIEYLLNKCIRFIIDHMDVSNVIDYHLFAHSVGVDNLKKHTFEYIEAYFSEVAQCDKFLEIPFNILEEFLRSDHISVTNEGYVFEIAEKWMLHNSENRVKYAHDLLRNVRFNLISPGGFIFSKLYKKRILDSVDIIRDVIFEFDCDSVGIIPKVSTNSYSPLTRRTRRKHVFIFGNQKKEDCSRMLALRYNGDVIKELNALTDLTDCKHLQSTALRDRIFLSTFETDSVRSFKYFNNHDNIWSCVRVVDNNNPVFNMISLDSLNTIYINFKNPSFGSDTSLYSMYCYNADIDEWNTVYDSPYVGCNAALISYKNVFYSCGVMVTNSRCATTETKLALFDPRCGWKNLANLPIICHNAAGTVLNDKMYITGGRTKDSVYSVCFMYDFRANYWSELKSMSRQRHSHSLLPYNNKLYVIGGQHSVTEIYDPILNTWEDGIDINYFTENVVASILF